MLETSMSAALASRLANAIATNCNWCDARRRSMRPVRPILLLHQWIPLWQAFGFAGATILLIESRFTQSGNPAVATS